MTYVLYEFGSCQTCQTLVWQLPNSGLTAAKLFGSCRTLVWQLKFGSCQTRSLQ